MIVQDSYKGAIDRLVRIVRNGKEVSITTLTHKEAYKEVADGVRFELERKRIQLQYKSVVINRVPTIQIRRLKG
jgi:hypothetical protein